MAIKKLLPNSMADRAGAEEIGQIIVMRILIPIDRIQILHLSDDAKGWIFQFNSGMLEEDNFLFFPFTKGLIFW